MSETVERGAHDSRPALVPASGSAGVLVPFRAPAMPKCAEPVGDLNARHVTDSRIAAAMSAPRPLRSMLCVDVLSGFARFTVRRGFVDAYDHGDLCGAPVGSFLIADSLEDPDKGVVLAELTSRGWEHRGEGWRR